MSIPTATTRATPAASSLASSTKFRTFAVTFAVAGTVTYLLCLQFNWPMFTFHPAVNRLEWGWGPARSGEGPTMYWYGWTATTVIAAAIAGFLATLLPESIAKKFPLILVWLLPILAIPYLIYDLRSWWLHP
jgi:DNA-binding transcriptional LysR family regulator